MPELIFLAAAEVALQEIYSRFEESSALGGEKFLQSVEAGLSQIRRFPQSGSQFHGRYRRLLIPSYRYGIIYCLEGGRIVVARVTDLRQNPEDIRRSLGE